MRLGSVRSFAFRAVFVVVVVSGLLLREEVARAQAPRKPLVVLLRPTSADTSVGEALIRLNGELVEAGFDVTVVDGKAGDDPRTAIAEAGRNLAPSVTIGLFGDSEQALELWIADKLTGKTVVRRMEASGEPGGRASEVLAIRTAELLRASLMELLVRTPSRSPESSTPNHPPPEVARWAAKDLAPPVSTSRWALEVGATVLGSFEGLRPAVAPVFRGRIAIGWQTYLRVTGVGLGTHPTVEASAGSASVDQTLLLVEAAHRWSMGGGMGPQISMGAGAYRFGVQGRADWPYRGVEDQRWSGAVDVGAGFIVPLHSYVEAALEAHAVFAEPYPAAQLFEEIAARAGRPTWMCTVTLAGWL